MVHILFLYIWIFFGNEEGDLRPSKVVVLPIDLSPGIGGLLMTQWRDGSQWRGTDESMANRRNRHDVFLCMWFALVNLLRIGDLWEKKRGDLPLRCEIRQNWVAFSHAQHFLSCSGLFSWFYWDSPYRIHKVPRNSQRLPCKAGPMTHTRGQIWNAGGQGSFPPTGWRRNKTAPGPTETRQVSFGAGKYNNVGKTMP